MSISPASAASAFSSAILLVSLALGAPAAPLRAESPPVVEIWPEGVPGGHPEAAPEKSGPGGHFSEVNRPTLTVYAPPAGKANGTAVVICPGGGYVWLAFGHEGIGAAEWCRSLGVTAFVLKYRMKEYGHPAPLRDALRAIRLVRSRAADFGVRPDRIGILGFSAGGHLAATAATLYDAPEGRTGAALDSVSARPDFLVLIYPVITMQPPYLHAGSRRSLLGAEPSPELARHLSAELQVTERTPPAFIVHSEEDSSVPVENSVLFYRALRQAAVPAELHLYAKGKHGIALDPGNGPISGWPGSCEEWMRFNGWLPAPR